MTGSERPSKPSPGYGGRKRRNTLNGSKAGIRAYHERNLMLHGAESPDVRYQDNDWTERFDNVIDSGLFHVFSDEDRRRYVEGLAAVL